MQISRRLFPFYLVTVSSARMILKFPQIFCPQPPLPPPSALPQTKGSESGPHSFLSFAGLSLASSLRGNFPATALSPSFGPAQLPSQHQDPSGGQSGGVRPRAGCSPSYYFPESLNLWGTMFM